MNKGTFSGMKGEAGAAKTGQGGALLTGNVTLTSSSPASMVVTPATPGLYVTLPDATSMAKSMSQFSVYNAGEYDYGIKNSAGIQLGWVRAGIGAIIGLSDNTSATGIWALAGVEKLGITGELFSSTIATAIQTLAIDANRTLILYTDVNVLLYGVIYNSLSNIWGSPVLIRNANSTAIVAILSASEQVLVTSIAATTAFEAVTLTISINTINVNTAVPITLAGGCDGTSITCWLIAVGTSWVISNHRAAGSWIRAISLSGTVPTVGAETIISAGLNSSPALLFASGSIVRTITSEASLLLSTPYTVSGSTLALGAGATVAKTTENGVQPRAFVNGNGNIVCVYNNTTVYASVSKLTGTTEALTTINTALGVTNYVSAEIDYGVVSASKAVLSRYLSGLSTFAIITDTAGTVSVGSIVQYAYSIIGGSFIPYIGTFGGNFVFSGGNVFVSLNCSGVTPTLANINILNGYIINSPTVTDTKNRRDFQKFITSGNVLVSPNRSSQTNIFTASYSANGCSYFLPVKNYTNGIVGVGNTDSYGCVLNKMQRIEAAA